MRQFCHWNTGKRQQTNEDLQKCKNLVYHCLLILWLFSNCATLRTTIIMEYVVNLVSHSTLSCYESKQILASIIVNYVWLFHWTLNAFSHSASRFYFYCGAHLSIATLFFSTIFLSYVFEAYSPSLEHAIRMSARSVAIYFFSLLPIFRWCCCCCLAMWRTRLLYSHCRCHFCFNEGDRHRSKQNKHTSSSLWWTNDEQKKIHRK